MKAEEPILNIDCARLRDLSFVAPLQMEMGTVSTDAAAGVNYGLDKGPLPCAGEGGCAPSGCASHWWSWSRRGASSRGFGQATADRRRSSRPGREPEKSNVATIASAAHATRGAAQAGYN